MGKKKVTLSIDSKIYSDFQKYCEDNAIMLSKKIEILIRDLMKKKGKSGLSLLFFLFIGLFFICNINAQLIERGSYWEKNIKGYDNYDIKIYNSIINYNNGSNYNLITYGKCGTNCFRDWNGLIYRISNDDKKAYVNVYNPDGDYISSFGFGITGSVGGVNYKYSTLNFSWIWSEIDSNSSGEYIFKAWNNRTNFNWTQEYHFYPNQSMKIRNTIVNNLGVNILNTKFWFIQTVNESSGIWFNGTKYNQDTYKTGNFDNLISKIKFEDNYVFSYDDLLLNGFNITDFYLGNGDVIGVSSIRILAIGITKGNSVFPDSYSVTVDPSISISGSEGGGDSYVASGSPNTNLGDSIELQVRKSSPTWRIYLLFNISTIPRNQIIDNASLCMFLYDDTSGANYIYAHHVYNKSWCEGNGGSDGSPACEITWNNQPCGDNLDNSSKCNLTSESYITTYDTTAKLDNTWQCWKIKDMIEKEYINNSDKIAIAIETNYSGSADKFYSKEYSNFSLRPYLNISYHLMDMILPSVSVIYPLNQSYSTNISNLNYSYYDQNPGYCFYSNSSGIWNSSSVPAGVNFTGMVPKEGSNNWIVYCNDSVGNLNSSMISFFIDTTPPNINIILPEEKTYGYNTSLALNYSITDASSLSSCWWNLDSGLNRTISCSQNISFNASDGNHVINFYSNDSLGNIGYSNRSFSVSTTLAVALLRPLDNSWVNYNSNIKLNYSVNTASNIINCSLYGDWSNIWHLNKTNSSLINSSGGENKFYVNLSDGSYVWNVRCFAGSYNSFAFSNYSLNIDSVNPILDINYPINNTIYRQNVSILINFSDYDLNLDSCYYSFDNGINNYSIDCINGINTLNTNYRIGNYNLTIYANDSANNLNKKIIYNITIEEDIFAPNVVLSEPVGTKNSKTGIPISFSVSDNVDNINELNCNYNVRYIATGGFVPGLENVNLPNCLSSSFNVPSDSDYILYLSAEDRTGNSALVSSNFSVLTSVIIPPSGGGGSYSGGGGFVIPKQNISSKAGLEVNKIGSIIAREGEKKTLSLSSKNTGNIFLNNCRLVLKGDVSSWFYNKDLVGIAPGENKIFVFDINVPEEVKAGEFFTNLSVVCNEMINIQEIMIDIPLGLKTIEIKEIKHQKNGLNISYYFNQSGAGEKNIIVEIWLIDKDKLEIKRIKDSFEISKKGVFERNVLMEIPEDLAGVYYLYFALSSDLDNYKKQSIILGKSSKTGMAILDNPRNKKYFFWIFVVIIIFGILFALWKSRDNASGVILKDDIYYPSIMNRVFSKA